MSDMRNTKENGSRILMLESPQLFYTPLELKDGGPRIYLHFDNSSIHNYNFSEGGEFISSMKITRVLYEKVQFRNAKFDWIYVMSTGMEQFKEIYGCEGLV